jgi:hypothetical protein
MTPRNFQSELKKQLRFLRTSSDAYDNGDKEEAVRLATILATLFHDGGQSQSLLSHLKLKDIRLLSSSARGKSSLGNLTTVSIDPVGLCEFKPAFAAYPPNFVQFEVWWRKEKVFTSPEINRRDLTLWARNKDGGAHVDAELHEVYEQLVKGVGWKLSQHLADGTLVREVAFANAHFAALRQIAYEVLNTPSMDLT